MKIKLFVIALLVTVAGFGACKKTPSSSKSSEKEIISITDSNAKTWSVNAATSTWTGVYPKGFNNWNLTLTITCSNKATRDPSGSINFSANKTQTVTVIAEDGTQKPWTLKVENEQP